MYIKLIYVEFGNKKFVAQLGYSSYINHAFVL